MTYANDRESTLAEYAEALDIETQQQMWLNWMDKRHMSDWTDAEMAKYGRLTGQDVPAPSADEQATDEEGGKDISARPTRTACDWMREEGVLRELPN